MSILSLLSGAAMILAELAMEAGLPKGVLNIVHGTNVSSLLIPFMYSIHQFTLYFHLLIIVISCFIDTLHPVQACIGTELYW